MAPGLTPLQERVNAHILRYSGTEWAKLLRPLVAQAPEDRLHKALDRWTPTTIQEVLTCQPQKSDF